MLLLKEISYLHPNKDLLFESINLSVNNQTKIALVGNNGIGKSTLLKIIAGKLPVSSGKLVMAEKPYYAPQVFGQFNHLTVAQALGIADKLTALKRILSGSVTDSDLIMLDEDWAIEERCKEALSYWQLPGLDLEQKMDTLSGGQKTSIFLAGISIHQPGFVLLDEPSNHLDKAARSILYNYIQSTQSTLMVVSHDRKLLRLLDTVCELKKKGITVYGGNYDFYLDQKQIENTALDLELKTMEKTLRKARQKKRETTERQHKLDARGKKKQEKAGMPTIMMNTLRNSAEQSTSRIKNVHAEKINCQTHDLQELRSTLPGVDKMKIGFDHSALHRGKVLFTASGINHGFRDKLLWPENLSFQIRSGERIAFMGSNGSGKTTLIKIILGKLEPGTGKVYRAENRCIYIDQDYLLVNNSLSVYEQAQQFNVAGLQEHEIKTRLKRFLFTKEDWDKSCNILSGGEKMRMILCCLTLNNQPPDIIMLDEPTNNLDVQNIEILTNAINEYQGTLIVVSHDEYFLEQLNVAKTIIL